MQANALQFVRARSALSYAVRVMLAARANRSAIPGSKEGSLLSIQSELLPRLEALHRQENVQSAAETGFVAYERSDGSDAFQDDAPINDVKWSTDTAGQERSHSRPPEGCHSATVASENGSDAQSVKADVASIST